jgi:hypothetical protein
MGSAGWNPMDTNVDPCDAMITATSDLIGWTP